MLTDPSFVELKEKVEEEKKEVELVNDSARNLIGKGGQTGRFGAASDKLTGQISNRYGSDKEVGDTIIGSRHDSDIDGIENPPT